LAHPFPVYQGGDRSRRRGRVDSTVHLSRSASRRSSGRVPAGLASGTR